MSITEHGVQDLLSFGLDAGEVLRAAERFGVQLVDVLRPRRPGGEPAGLGDDLQAAERLAVTRRGGQPAQHRLAAALGDADPVGSEPAPGPPLLTPGPGLDP